MTIIPASRLSCSDLARLGNNLKPAKGSIPINELAKEFGGNGHRNAAGARLFNVTLDDVIAQVIEKAGKYVSTLKG